MSVSRTFIVKKKYKPERTEIWSFFLESVSSEPRETDISVNRGSPKWRLKMQIESTLDYRRR